MNKGLYTYKDNDGKRQIIEKMALDKLVLKKMEMQKESDNGTCNYKKLAKYALDEMDCLIYPSEGLRQVIKNRQKALGLLQSNERSKFENSINRMKKANEKMYKAKKELETAKGILERAEKLNKSLIKTNSKNDMFLPLNNLNANIKYSKDVGNVITDALFDRRIDSLLKVSRETIVENNVKNVYILLTGDVLSDCSTQAIRKASSVVVKAVKNLLEVCPNVYYEGIRVDRKTYYNVEEVKALNEVNERVEDSLSFSNRKSSISENMSVFNEQYTKEIKGKTIHIGRVKGKSIPDVRLYQDLLGRMGIWKVSDGKYSLANGSLFKREESLSPIAQMAILINRKEVNVKELKF